MLISKFTNNGFHLRAMEGNRLFALEPNLANNKAIELYRHGETPRAVELFNIEQEGYLQFIGEAVTGKQMAELLEIEEQDGLYYFGDENIIYFTANAKGEIRVFADGGTVLEIFDGSFGIIIRKEFTPEGWRR